METTIHELAEIFPELSAEQFIDLKEDIKENGQLNPIITYKGAIVDGKNRHKALTELKMDPIFNEFEGDPDKLVEYVISQNLKRRHLNSSQRAVSAQKSLEAFKAQAKKRQGQRNDLKNENDTPPPVQGPSAETAAKMFGTNRKYVNDVQKIQEKAPQLIKELESGAKTVTQALKEVKLKEQAEAAANRNDEQTHNVFRQLYDSKHGRRFRDINVTSEMEQNFAKIVESYKTHQNDLSDVLHKFQTNGNGQPNHAAFNDTINECNGLITFLKKMILLYEAANKNVQFYADNRDTLNKAYEKEAKKIVEEFKPVWKIDFYDDQGKLKHTSEFTNNDVRKVKKAMSTKIARNNCKKAIATVVKGKPSDLNIFHELYVKIKEFKHDPITYIPIALK